MTEKTSGAFFPPHAEKNFFIAASELISQGYPCFPCDGNKKPLTPHGFKDASRSLEQIVVWGKQFPDALAAVPTGGQSGLFVVDIDVKNGVNGFETLAANNWAMPLTRSHSTTTGGGRHFLFRWVDGLNNTAGVLGSGIDTRGRGGYIVWWPALGYEIFNSEILDVPSWILNGLNQRPHGPSVDDFSQDPILAGKRNDVLFRQASKWRSQGLDYSKILLLLRAENKLRCQPPLGDSEIVKIAGSAAAFDLNEKSRGKNAENAGTAGEAHSVNYEPEPLRAPLVPPEAFPVKELGAVLGAAALALHESVQAPLSLCVQSVLASASLAAQPHYDVLLPWGEKKPLSLYLLSVADSGERKTALDDIVLGAAKAQEREDMEGYSDLLKDYETELAQWKENNTEAIKLTAKARNGAAKDQADAAKHNVGAKPEPPILPLFFVSDPTIEGLYKLLAIGQPSVGLFSDEGGLFFGGHGMIQDNALKTLSRLSKIWDGSPFDRVRAGDGSGVLYGRRLALHQQAQPIVMAQLLNDALANGQGFLSRCLVVWPESTIGTRFIKEYDQPYFRPDLKKLFAKLKTLIETAPRTSKNNQVLNPVELPLTKDATTMAIAASNEFEALMQTGNDLCELRDRASKALEIACRIAGVMTVIEEGLSARFINDDRLGRALIIIQWYLAEALRIRGVAVIPQAVYDAESLSKWLAERGIRMFRSTQIFHKGPNQLRDKQRLDAAIEKLLEGGYISANESGTFVDGVTAKKSWRVHHVV